MKDKMDKYEAQEGKVIDFYDGCGHHYKALVVGCDKTVGITIINNENHDDYLYCITGPSSPLWDKDFPNEIVLKIITFIRDQIKKGVVCMKDKKTFQYSLGCTRTCGHNPSQESCSFGQ